VISGRRSGGVEHRMQELGVPYIVQGCKDKVAALDAILEELGITPSKRTMALYHQIQNEQLPVIHETPLILTSTASLQKQKPVSRTTHDWLEQLHTELSQLQQTVQQKILVIEGILVNQDRSEIRFE